MPSSEKQFYNSRIKLTTNWRSSNHMSLRSLSRSKTSEKSSSSLVAKIASASFLNVNSLVKNHISAIWLLIECCFYSSVLFNEKSDFIIWNV